MHRQHYLVVPGSRAIIVWVPSLSFFRAHGAPRGSRQEEDAPFCFAPLASRCRRIRAAQGPLCCQVGQPGLVQRGKFGNRKGIKLFSSQSIKHRLGSKGTPRQRFSSGGGPRRKSQNSDHSEFHPTGVWSWSLRRNKPWDDGLAWRKLAFHVVTETSLEAGVLRPPRLRWAQDVEVLQLSLQAVLRVFWFSVPFTRSRTAS